MLQPQRVAAGLKGIAGWSMEHGFSQRQCMQASMLRAEPYLARGGPEAALLLHAVHDDVPQLLRPLHGQRLSVPVCHLHRRGKSPQDQNDYHHQAADKNEAV